MNKETSNQGERANRKISGDVKKKLVHTIKFQYKYHF
jgi:hypothetical protein